MFTSSLTFALFLVIVLLGVAHGAVDDKSIKENRKGRKDDYEKLAFYELYSPCYLDWTSCDEKGRLISVNLSKSNISLLLFVSVDFKSSNTHILSN